MDMRQKKEMTIPASLDTIRNFVRETTGLDATDTEIARSLTRYFVLNEIREHIVMEREERRAGRDLPAVIAGD